jgi:hypothetical protein
MEQVETQDDQKTVKIIRNGGGIQRKNKYREFKKKT